MRKTIFLIVTVLFFFSCGTENSREHITSNLNLTPQLQSVNLKDGQLDLNPTQVVSFVFAMKRLSLFSKMC